MQVTQLGHLMAKNDNRTRAVSCKPKGLQTYPADNGHARLLLDLYMPQELSRKIIALISADILEANGR